MVQFTNPEVSEKYEACRSTDGKVHIPAGKKVPGGPDDRVSYSGPLSGITPAAAEKALNSGSNILKLKPKAEAPKKETVKASSNGQQST